MGKITSGLMIGAALATAWSGAARAEIRPAPPPGPPDFRCPVRADGAGPAGADEKALAMGDYPTD